MSFLRLLPLLPLLACALARAEVYVSTATPSWTALNAAGKGVAHVDIRLRPGTTPANASFVVETIPASGRFTLSAPRLTLSRAGSARLTVTSLGESAVKVILREVTSGGQTLSAELNFHGPLAIKPTAVVSNTAPFDLGISGGVPPYTLKATPADILGFRPDGTAAAHGSKAGMVVVTVTDARRKTARGEVLVRLPASPSLQASNWLVRSTVAIIRPVNLTNAPGWFLDFPTVASGRNVGYVMEAMPFRYIAGSALEARFTLVTEGPVVFDHRTAPNNTSDFPAHVRFLLQNGPISLDAHGRWWSNPIAVKLQPGSFTLRVPLDPGQWSNVWGQVGDLDDSTRAGFAHVLANISEMGFTFGGGFFFGHGVRVSGGSARFILTGFDVLP